MNKLLKILLSTFIMSIILLNFEDEIFATELSDNYGDVIYKQESQMKLFDTLVKESNITQKADGIKNLDTHIDNKDINIDINEFGDLFFDENDNLHFKYKKSLLSTNKNLRELLTTLNEQGIAVEAGIYTHSDLFKQQMLIYEEIKYYYGGEENLPPISLTPDIFEEKVILSFETLDENLLAQLKSKYDSILKFIKEEIEILKTEKSQSGNWNNLGAGIAINNDCSIAGIATKNGNYFLITAAHCFSGVVASDGTGSIVRQNVFNVGRQHAEAQSVNLDFGLVKIMGDNFLTGGRYVTNGIRVSSDSTSEEIFDNKLVAAESTGAAFSQVVCRAGFKTAEKCGRIIQKGQIRSNWDDNTTKKVSVVVPDDYATYSTGGDSGGAVYRKTTSGYILTGVHVGRGSSHAYFTDIMDGLNYYDAYLYTSNTRIKVLN